MALEREKGRTKSEDDCIYLHNECGCVCVYTYMYVCAGWKELMEVSKKAVEH